MLEPPRKRAYHTAAYFFTGLFCIQTFDYEQNTVSLFRYMEDDKVKLFNTEAEAWEYAKRL